MGEAIVERCVDFPHRAEIEVFIGALFRFVAFGKLLSTPVFAGIFEEIKVVVIPCGARFVGPDHGIAICYLAEIHTSHHFYEVIDIAYNSAIVIVLVRCYFSGIVAVVNHIILFVIPLPVFLVAEQTAHI